MGKYMAKLSVQREKSVGGRLRYLPLLFRVFPCNACSPVCSSVVTTAPSSTVCSVTFSATAPVVSAASFVPSLEVTPAEPDHKQHRVDTFEMR